MLVVWLGHIEVTSWICIWLYSGICSCGYIPDYATDYNVGCNNIVAACVVAIGVFYSISGFSLITSYIWMVVYTYLLYTI